MEQKIGRTVTLFNLFDKLSSDNMKVCMVIPEFVPSMGKPPLYIAKRLIKSGHDVTVLTSDLDLADRKIKYKVDELKGATTIRMRGFVALKKILFPGIIFKLPFVKADVIYADGLGHFSSLCAAVIGRLRRIPVVLRADWNGMPIIEKGLKGIYDRYLKFPTLKHSTKILVFSKEQKEMMANYGINREKIDIVPNGADYDTFFSKTKSDYLRKRLNVGENTKIILTVCRIVPEKNPELAIKALANVGGSHKDTVAVIIGQKSDSQYYDYLVGLIKELGLEDKVFFLLEVNHKDMPDVYASADIFFLTSKPIEGMNISSVEAMCAGLPILTTEVSVTPEIVEEAKCGYAIKGEKDAAERIAFLLKREDVRKKLGENGQKFASTNLTWEMLTTDIEETMASVISHKGRKLH